MYPSECSAFVDADTLKDIGFWSEMFKDIPRTIPVFCEKCKCKRMHRRSDIFPEKQLIHDGKKWKNIIIGLYFDCVYCKDKYSEYYNNHTVVDHVTICPVCGSAYKESYSASCPSCKIVHNWKLLSNDDKNIKYHDGTENSGNSVIKGVLTGEKNDYRDMVIITSKKVISNNLIEKSTEKQISQIKFLEKLAKDIIWKWPDENVFVDRNEKCIVWKGAK